MWQIKTSHRGGVLVSTVKLPFPHPGGIYETCIFGSDERSEVVERYQTKLLACAGHQKHASKYGPSIKWYEILWYNLTY